MSFSNLLESFNVAKNKDIFIVTLEDIEIPFVLPPIKLASQISKLLSIIEEPYLKYLSMQFLFEKCVTDGFLAKNPDLPCGIPETIASVILYLSGINDSSLEYTETLLDVARNQAKEMYSIMKQTICSTFGGYTFESLDALNYQEIVSLFAAAEKVLVDNNILEKEFEITRKEDQKVIPISQQITQDAREFSNFEQQPLPKQNYNLRNMRRGG